MKLSALPRTPTGELSRDKLLPAELTLGIAFPWMTGQRILIRKISLFFRYDHGVPESNMSQHDGSGQDVAAVKTEAAVSRDGAAGDHNGDAGTKGHRM